MKQLLILTYVPSFFGLQATPRNGTVSYLLLFHALFHALLDDWQVTARMQKGQEFSSL